MVNIKEYQEILLTSRCQYLV